MNVSQLTIPLLQNNVTALVPKRLRDYQLKVINQINEHWNAGIKSVMLVSPTGSGKTLTATHIVKSFVDKGKRVLFIIHREPLVTQTVETLHNYGVESVGYIKAGYPHATDSDAVIVGSIQTLARRDYPNNIDLVVFDETHTTSFFKTAKELISFYAQFPVMDLSQVKFLHLTATPFRLKRKEYFGNHVQAIVEAPHIGELIRRGYLVTARHFGYDGLNDYSKLETGNDGDFKKSQVAVLCEKPEFNQAIVNKFLDFCPDRKTIVFAASVKQSLFLTRLFNSVGINAEHIQAETPTELRHQIFKRLKTGETQVLSSVGTLTEGFDEPSIDAVILARPTKSVALYIQMCGRGLRLFPNKKDCYILDFGGNTTRFKRVDSKRTISLCPQPFFKPDDDKQCPECDSWVNKFCRICPDCGYVFLEEEGGGGGKKDDQWFIESIFGELLDNETMDQIKYIRSQRKTRFTKGLPPDPLWETWDKKFPGKLFCNDWLYGAVFRGDQSDAAQKLFENYLLQCYPNPKPKWLKFHLELEFNNPRLRDKSKAEISYNVPPGLAVRSWWQVLQIDPLSTSEQIREAYKSLASKSHFDNELIQRLNQAYDQAMFFYEVSITTESRTLLKSNTIEYSQLIKQTDREINRLNWTKEQAINYLVSKYNKRSRRLLTDSELIDLLTNLSVLQSSNY